MSIMSCLNCSNEFEGNFCPACGQSATTQRFQLQQLPAQVISVVTDLNRGFLRNVLDLSKDPAKHIRKYLQGQRVGYYNPLQYVLIGVTLLILLEIRTKYDLGVEVPQSMEDSSAFKSGYKAGQFLRDNLKFFWLALVIYFALPARLFFPRFNLAEHLLISSFIVGHMSLLSLPTFPLFRVSFLINPFLHIGILVMLVRFYRQEESIGMVILSSFFIQFIGYTLLVSVLFLLTLFL